MKSSLAFIAGFGAGWLIRSAVGSSASAAVEILAFTLDAAARVKRKVALEREQLEDLVAEAQDTVARRRAARMQRDEETGAVEHAA